MAQAAAPVYLLQLLLDAKLDLVMPGCALLGIQAETQGKILKDFLHDLALVIPLFKANVELQ